MSKATNFATNLLKLVCQNVGYANVGDVTGLRPSSAAGNLYVALHTGDPGLSGDQTVNEATYTGYARVAVTRDSGGWNVASGQVSNVAIIDFAICTGGNNTITHVSIGTSASGAGQVLWSFPVIVTYFDSTAKASDDTITAPGHDLAIDNRVQFVAAPGGTLPAGISAGVTYFVKTVSGNSITISATLGGSTLDVTSDGAALLGQIGSLSVFSNVVPEFAAGDLKITEL